MRAEISNKINLKLECTAIGSLPHTNANEAMELVKSNFSRIPFWPQLVKVNKNEDMIFQFLEGMPSFFCEDNKIFLDTEYETFCEDFEEFFNSYEECITDLSSPQLEKFRITKSSTFEHYLTLIQKLKPNFAKGQIVGPFTLATTLCKKDDTAAIYDETLREIIVKTLSLKALWQIEKIKSANPDTTPIIFIDEPSISQIGTSAFVGITQEEATAMISEVAELINQNEGLAAIHCCGKCDWTIPLKSGVKIINPDAYTYAQNLSIFSSEISTFLNNGGIIAWGIVPTLDKTALENTNIPDLIEKFKTAVNYLTKKGINEKLIIENSMLTPSCGAGGLDVKMSEKAMDLTKQLSIQLKEIYNFDN